MQFCQGLYSSVAERQSCKLKVLGSIPSGGLLQDCISSHPFKPSCLPCLMHKCPKHGGQKNLLHQGPQEGKWLGSPCMCSCEGSFAQVLPNICPNTSKCTVCHAAAPSLCLSAEVFEQHVQVHLVGFLCLACVGGGGCLPQLQQAGNSQPGPIPDAHH